MGDNDLLKGCLLVLHAVEMNVLQGSPGASAGRAELHHEFGLFPGDQHLMQHASHSCTRKTGVIFGPVFLTMHVWMP